MGYVPITRPTEEQIVATLERDLRHRRSRLHGRRRRAYSACVALIRRRELALEMVQFPQPGGLPPAARIARG